MAYIFCTTILWVILISIVPYKGWRRYYPTLIFAGLLGIFCDLYGIIFQQWTYHGPTVGGLSLWSVLGIAPAEGVLFIRLFPKQKNSLIKIVYWLSWALLNTVAERFFCLGWMGWV